MIDRKLNGSWYVMGTGEVGLFLSGVLVMRLDLEEMDFVCLPPKEIDFKDMTIKKLHRPVQIPDVCV